MKALLIASAFAFATALSAVAKDTAEVGKPAPEFTLPGADGKNHSPVSENKGKIIVLEWTNPGCPFVQKFYAPKEMQKLQKEMKEKGVVWYRINSSAEGQEGHQNVEQAAKYDKAHGVEAKATLLDHDGKVGRLYGAKTTPHMYIIDTTGTLVYNGAIDDMATPRSGDIALAKNYVRQAVDELLAGKPVSNHTTKPYGCSVKYK